MSVSNTCPHKRCRVVSHEWLFWLLLGLALIVIVLDESFRFTFRF